MLIKVLGRVKTMFESGGVEEAAMWVKEMACVPTYDRPGRTAKNRITFSVLGQVLVPKDEGAEDQLAKDQADALKSGDWVRAQRTPLELPTHMMQMEGKMVPMHLILGTLFRAPEAEVCLNKAARGHLARTISRKK